MKSISRRRTLIMLLYLSGHLKDKVERAHVPIARFNLHDAHDADVVLLFRFDKAGICRSRIISSSDVKFLLLESC